MEYLASLTLSLTAQTCEAKRLNWLNSCVTEGPDWSGIWHDNNAILCHERLAIVDVDTGAQPLVSDDGNLILSVNGEIYNHKELQTSEANDYQFATKSDCEIILPLYKKYGCDFIDMLKGMFAFVLYDKNTGDYLIARDHIGIIPLYTGFDEHGNFYVASEMKALVPVCKTVQEFPPGHYMLNGSLNKYYQRDWMQHESVQANISDLDELKSAFEKAVKSHLMSDVPYGVFTIRRIRFFISFRPLLLATWQNELRMKTKLTPGGRDCTASQ